jgi:hypothetical protein
VLLLLFAGLEFTEPRWLVTVFGLVLLAGGLLTHRRWHLWARDAMVQYQTILQAEKDGEEPPPEHRSDAEAPSA